MYLTQRGTRKMYSNILNNWFYGEDVQVDDMKLLTKSFLQLCFAANGGNVMATGITPTITGNNIATTKGFVYFGETSDAIFIERTGTNQLISFVDPTSVPLIANGYLYVKPIITYDVNNRTSTVSGVVYTSTSATAEGINLATITNSVITQVNSINPLGATQLQRGITQLATQAEVNAGTVTNKAVAPSTFAASTQLAAKAPLVSPALTGTPTVNGYGVATYNAGFNRSVILTSGQVYEVAATDANLCLRAPATGTATINLRGNTVNFPHGFTVYVGQSVGAGTVTVNQYTYGGTLSSNLISANSGIHQYTWDGNGASSVAANGWWVDGIGDYNGALQVGTLGSGIVASGSNANGNWVKYASGFIQQWGRVTITANSQLNLNLPIAFININTICPQMSADDVTQNLTNYRWGISVLSVSQLRMYNGWDEGPIGYYWQAEGY